MISFYLLNILLIMINNYYFMYLQKKQKLFSVLGPLVLIKKDIHFLIAYIFFKDFFLASIRFRLLFSICNLVKSSTKKFGASNKNLIEVHK